MSQAKPTPDKTIPAAQGGLLATKLYARPGRAMLVDRPRLTRLLDDGRSASLILVSAAAGFGKTTLLGDWLRQRPYRSCWLSLDAADNDPARFLSYVIAAIQRVAPGVAGDLPALLRSPESPSAEAVIADLVNELSSMPEELILVLDDYHVITSTAVNGALGFLLDNLPPNLHLVISSRADPPIPIARLRSRAQVVEVRTDDLRFTPDEAAAFLGDTMGLSLSPEQVAALDERAEGWIAGLQMAALSMRSREDLDGFIQAFAGTNRFILDFLVEEVLGREPEDVQAFLLQTAVLTRLSGPLCDAVIGTGTSDSQQMLERLERRNLFVVSLDDDRHWYRYHHLFADLLQARLHQSGRELVARLQVRAAEWCEQAGQVIEAVNYALAAKDYERAKRLIADYWPRAAGEGEVETVLSWLGALPEDVVGNSAMLSVGYGWMLWLKGRMDAVETHLLDAEAALAGLIADEKPSGEGQIFASSVPALVATLRSVVCRYRNDFPAATAHAARALSLAPKNLPPQADGQLRGLISLMLATAYDGAGELEKAVDAYAEAIRLSCLGKSATGVAGPTYRLISLLQLLGRLGAADEAGRESLRFMEEMGMARLPAASVLHLGLAGVLLERNELEAAQDHLSQGLELGRWRGRFDAVINAAPVLVRLRLARGDASGALVAVDEAESALGEPPSPLAKAELLALKAGILIRQGCQAEAAACAGEAGRLAGQDRGQTGKLVALAAIRAQIARSRPDEAVAALTRSLAGAEREGLRGLAMEFRILRSLALRRSGMERDAEAELRAALILAEPEGYVRVFVDEGESLAGLLRKLATHPGASAESSGYSTGYLARLLAAFGEPDGIPSATSLPPPGRTVTSLVPSRTERGVPVRGSPALIEPLSEREREVLGLMAEGLTNEQIAARLIIALGTVKAHIHNISGKLSAQNRGHAVARAKELGLL